MNPAGSERRDSWWAGPGARGALLFVLGGVAGGTLFATWSAQHGAATTPASAPSGNNVSVATERAGTVAGRSFAAVDLSQRGVLRWLAVGGGADPTATQVQLEQDLALFVELAGAREVPGAVLFAGGPGVRAVQVLDPAAAPDGDAHQGLRAELGRLLDPRPERDARFRIPRLKVDAPAEAAAVLATLQGQLALPGERLDVFIAAHGDVGESPAENYVSLWEDSSFDARELAAAVASPDARRSARFVITACFGGGFAELAFAGADVSAGPARHGACGLFATSAEHESNGCDANPDRQAQEGYALHLLHALRGQTRDGQSATGIDLDADGRIGLLEAHTRARMASESIDMPSTTSERFLRSLDLSAAASNEVPPTNYNTPEDDAVIAALGARLGLAEESAVAAARVSAEAQLDTLAARIDEQLVAEEDALHAIRLSVATRWPELLDPFRADFEATLSANASAVAALLDSREARVHARLQETSDRLLMEEDALRLRWVLQMRLARAFETRRLARVLSARPLSDPARRYYEALLACERAPLGSAHL
jgi:hypothetical protein